MCGIACVCAPLSRTEREAVCALMVQALSHRGPDGAGLLSVPFSSQTAVLPESPDSTTITSGPGITLGHRRLAIVDPTPGGAQPMTRDGLALSWNGEVYNHRSLRQQAVLQGETFATQSDSEVLLSLLHRHGLVRALQAVEGPLAFALWDANTQTLHLARDRFGKKPLYVYRRGDSLLAASEPKAIVIAARRLGWPLSVHRQTLARYLADVEQEAGDETFFAQIQRVPFAHVVSFACSAHGLAQVSPQTTRYYRLLPASFAPTDHAAFLEQFRAQLAHSLALRLSCEGPVGALLSGGLDSSSLVCLAHEMGATLPTFSAVHGPGNPCDESAYIDQVVAQTGGPHVRVRPSEHLSPDAFLRFVVEQDEPTGGASVFAQACVFRLVQAHGLKVVLSGQGADEALTGYGGCWPFWLAETLRNADLASFASGLCAQHPTWSARLRATAQAGWLGFRETLPAPLAAFALSTKWHRAFAHAPFFHADRLGVPPIVESACEGLQPNALLHKYLFRLLTGSSLLTILRTEDRSSMACGVESRAPFLDPALVELCLACPPPWLLHRGRTKALLRDSLSSVLPPGIANRRDKIGFAAPQTDYLQNPLRPLVERFLQQSRLSAAGLLRKEALSAAWKRGLRTHAESHAVWKFLSVEAWLEAFDLPL